MNYKKAQSTVEYLLLVSAVIVVIILFTQNSGTFQNGLNNVFNTVTCSMINVANTLAQSTQTAQ